MCVCAVCCKPRGAMSDWCWKEVSLIVPARGICCKAVPQKHRHVWCLLLSFLWALTSPALSRWGSEHVQFCADEGVALRRRYHFCTQDARIDSPFEMLCAVALVCSLPACLLQWACLFLRAFSPAVRAVSAVAAQRRGLKWPVCDRALCLCVLLPQQQVLHPLLVVY